MQLFALVAVLTIATPVPLGRAGHVTAALPTGATAVVAAAGNNVPCWDSPASLSAFTNAFRANDRASVAMDIANNAVLLAEGDTVKSLGTQGLLGGITRLKILSGEHAGTACYEHAVLQIYRSIKSPKRRV